MKYRFEVEIEYKEGVSLEVAEADLNNLLLEAFEGQGEDGPVIGYDVTPANAINE